MPALVIRTVVPAEYELAGALVVEAYRTLGDVEGDLYERQLRDVQGRVGSGEVLVAKLDGRVVGCVTFAVAQTALSQVEDPDAATIRMLGVAPEARGHGIGEALMRVCIERARAAGRRRVRLDTRTSMAGAQRLYARLGFRREPTLDWSPSPGISLLAFVLELDEPNTDPDR